MNSVISSVILPGIGRVCPECFSRGYVGPLSLGPAEVYSFGVAEQHAQLDWDVDAARALIAARPRTAQRLDPTWLGRWLTERSHFTLEHLTHIPPEKLAEPGVLVEILASPPGGQPSRFRILIDGTHRAARRLRQGRACWAFLLTEDEQRSICAYRRHGHLVELPTTAGLGISDRQAGILISAGSEADVA
jgi:hypothetical protein